MVGADSADKSGPPVRQNSMNYGMDVDGVRVVEGQSTAVANILVEAKSGANRVIRYPGAGYALEPADLMTLESLGGGVAPDLVISQLEIRRDAIEQAIETADREGGRNTTESVASTLSHARYLTYGGTSGHE
jgi:sugar/nucleoside kinase (ribokinase family)